VTTWTTKPLGDVVAQMKTGSTPSTSRPEFFEGSIPWFTPGDIGSSRDLVKSSRTITKEALSTGKAKLFDENTLLVTCIGNIGRVGVLKQKSSSNQQITALKFPDEIDPYFAYYWFIFNQHKLENFANIAVVPILNNERMSDISFSYPPLPEQKWIAAQLAQADRLRQLRRSASQLGESYLQSVFLEMFGDPVSSKKFKVKRLEGFTNLVSSGSTPLGGSNVYQTSGKRFIRSQNVLMNGFDFSDVVFIDDETYNSMKRTFVQRNDVLLNITGASIGRVACYQDDTPANVNQHVCIIRCKPEKLNPVFLSFVISMPSFQERIIANQSGATRQALNFEQIKDFNIPIPPLPEQEHFAQIVARYERLRTQMRESTRQAEILFQGLLYESFGEQESASHHV
jgi:type I restriction enzyme, S subunit